MAHGWTREDGAPTMTPLEGAEDDFPLLTEAIGDVEIIEPQRMADGTQAWDDAMAPHADVAAPASEPDAEPLLASETADDTGEFALAAVEEGATPVAETEQAQEAETDLAEWLREQAAAHEHAHAAGAAAAVPDSTASHDIAPERESMPAAHEVAPGFGATPPSQPAASAIEITPAMQAPLAADDPRWAALAEEIRVQVLQRVDLFTEAGLQSQLQQHLQPIVDRASAELVATINRQVGQLLRAYVAEAIEREIEKWRSDTH